MNIKLTQRFEKSFPVGVSDTCTLEQYDDGSIYIIGNKLGELIIEFADDAYEKAVSQLRDLGYTLSAEANHSKQEAG